MRDGGQTTRIPAHFLSQLREEGFAVVPGILSPDELLGAIDHAFSLVPRPAPGAAGEVEPNFYAIHLPFGGEGHGLSQVALSSKLIGIAEALLGTGDVLLTRATLGAKYPGPVDFEQELHADYGNNLLDYPRNDGEFLTVDVIVYLTDVDERHGPTYVVPFSASGTDPGLRVVPREQGSLLYQSEIPAVVGAGGALLYTQSTLHRGSRYLANDGVRLAVHLVYKAAQAHATTAYPGWAHQAETMREHWTELIAELSPRQRQVLGFRPPGHPYWNEQTVAGVGRRYPGMDMTPYRRSKSLRKRGDV